MAKDFLDLVDSFDLIQSVFAPTQERGHTLDLVLSYALPVLNLKLCDPVFSDHMPVLFDIALPCNTVQACAPAQHFRVFNSSTAAQFAVCYTHECTINAPRDDNTDELSAWFHDTCQTVLNTVAPLKARQPKTKSEPWLNDETREVRRDCRRAERKWKKDNLQVSFQILKDCWELYQSTLKEAKWKYNILQRLFCQIVINHVCCTSPLKQFSFEVTFELCERFLYFFY